MVFSILSLYALAAICFQFMFPYIMSNFATNTHTVTHATSLSNRIGIWMTIYRGRLDAESVFIFRYLLRLIDTIKITNARYELIRFEKAFSYWVYGILLIHTLEVHLVAIPPYIAHTSVWVVSEFGKRVTSFTRSLADAAIDCDLIKKQLATSTSNNKFDKKKQKKKKTFSLSLSSSHLYVNLLTFGLYCLLSPTSRTQTLNFSSNARQREREKETLSSLSSGGSKRKTSTRCIATMSYGTAEWFGIPIPSHPLPA